MNNARMFRVAAVLTLMSAITYLRAAWPDLQSNP